MSWTHGRHNFKFGGQWWRQIIKTFYAGNNGQLGLMDFNGQIHQFRHFGGTGGDGGADFVLGLDYSIRSRRQHRQDLAAVQQRHRDLCRKTRGASRIA